jgi:asparagine N-glycosylation enzyme membrane subunit Stt3
MTGHLGFINIYSGGLFVFVQTSEKDTIREHQAEFLHMPKWGTTNLASSMFRRFFFFAFLISAIKVKKLGNKAVQLLHFAINQMM